jgi:DNA-binding transcriptional ArsR family regulator
VRLAPAFASIGGSRSRFDCWRNELDEYRACSAMSTARTALEKPLPNNLEAERSLLGAIMLDNATLPLVLKHICSGDFFLNEHKKIFTCMLNMSQAGTPIELVTLCESLAQERSIDLAGGAAYISTLGDGMPKVSNVEHYAKIVLNKSRLRQMIHATHKLQQQAFDSDADPDSLQATLRTAIADRGALKVVGGNGVLSYSLRDFLVAEFPVPEHLVEGLIPRESTVMIVAMPHHLKSWFTTSLALATSIAGENVLGKLVVKKPVRTLLVQLEDFPGQLQWRLRELLKTQAFRDCEFNNVRILPRCPLYFPDEGSYQNLLREVSEHKADHVIIDVVRRFFRGDINSSKETVPFLEQLDRLREATGATTTLVHHENRKEADLMYASAGSYTLPSWANVLIQFKRKTQEGPIAHVEIEADNKLAPAPEPMRMVLDLTSETPVRLENMEDTAGVQELRDHLGGEFTAKDLQEVLSVAKPNAYRRIKKLVAAGIIEKIAAGKRGRSGGLARYKFCEADDVAIPIRGRRDVN